MQATQTDKLASPACADACTANTLLRLTTRGLVIDAQCGRGGVVNLVVHAEKKHKGVWRRGFQHLANALFRAADACHPSQNNRALRVVFIGVPATPADDLLTDSANAHVIEVWPRHTADGDAHYQAFLVHEGVKRKHDGAAAFSQGRWLGRKKSADGPHLEPAVFKEGTTVQVCPDVARGTA